MTSLSRARVRRWGILTALLLIILAVLITGVAATNPTLLSTLQHPQDDIYLLTGFLIVAVFAGSLLFPLFLEPEDDSTDIYEPEMTPEIPYAGTDVEPLTKPLLFGQHTTEREQDTIRERLRDTTVAMIHRHIGVSTEEASARVRRGDWTENATAAWFLGETPPPRSVRFYARISDSLAFRHGARQTIHEIVAYDQAHSNNQESDP